MTFYEELDIASDASEDEIRQAHRRLVKLLHPDLQGNDDLRRLADKQMLRINSMVEILLDPRRRRHYDASLEAPMPSFERPEKFADVSQRKVRPNAVSIVWAAGGVAILTGVFFLWPDQSAKAKSSGSSKSAATTPSLPVRESPSDPNARRPQREVPTAVRREMSETQSPNRNAEISSSNRRPAAVSSPATTPSEPVQTAVTKVADKPAPAPASTSARSHHTAQSELAGTWLFVPEPAAKGRPELYQPEYIQLQIHESDGTVAGNFRSRYTIPDRLISPTVNFTFSGPSSDSPATFRWTNSSGGAGTVTLSLTGPNTLQVVWKVSEFGPGMSLVSGTSALVRKL